MNVLLNFLDGTLAMCFAVIGLFFLRYWRDTQDRLFLTFALAFWLLGAARIGLALVGGVDENDRFYFYLLRLVAYVLILYAIMEKNRFFKGRSKPVAPATTYEPRDRVPPPPTA